MNVKDNSTYVCMATIARKYIVASATIVRTNAENLSELLRWDVYITMTTNADNSKRFLLSTRYFTLTVGASASTYQIRYQ